MKKIRNSLVILIALAATFSTHAQVNLLVTNNDLRINLQKVITNFPNHLASVKGDTIEVNPQSIEYASLLSFKMAQENSVTQYKGIKPVYSWHATMLTTEDFEEAAKKYGWLFKELKAMTIKIDGSNFTINGVYDEPSESKKFSSSIFKLKSNNVNMLKLKIEVSLQFQFPEWKVSLLVYEKEREDNERGDIEED